MLIKGRSNIISNKFKEINNMKKMKEIHSYLGIHRINLSDSNNSLELQDSMPVFIFDYLSMSKHLRHELSDYTCQLCGYNPTSLDIIWVDGQDEFLKKDLLSFWLWDDNGLIPFAYIGKGAEKGPFSGHEGVLFLNATNHTEFNEMPIVLLNVEKDNVKLVSVADNFEALKIVKSKTNRQLSEQLKQEGNALFGKGDLEAAVNKFFEALQADSTNPNPYNNIGMVSQISNAHLDRGEAFFQLSFLADPEYTNGMRGYSGILASRGYLKKAIKIMKECIKLEKSALNYSILSRYYLDSNDTESAEKYYKKGIEIDQNHPELQKIEAKR